MTEPGFDEYPLHDAELLAAEVNWQARTLTLRLNVFYDLTDEAQPSLLSFADVAEVATAMRQPWGKSAFTTVLDQRQEAGGVYVLQLNTGDELRVVAAAAVLRRL